MKHVKGSFALIFTITFYFCPRLKKHRYQFKGYKIEDKSFIKKFSYQ